jgi:hypothetical protein
VELPTEVALCPFNLDYSNGIGEVEQRLLVRQYDLFSHVLKLRSFETYAEILSEKLLEIRYKFVAL